MGGTMPKKIALLSGKGGSGKTSLSLSISNLLANCGIKTLLLDCDFSTNGASYFFEDELNCEENVISLEQVFLNHKENGNVVKIQKNFDFIPSVSKINGAKFDSGLWKNVNFSFVDKISKKYDVVIYDCQAGYSDILEMILPEIDETLFVMEADAISSASIRSLHLKIGNLLKQKSYQVFNKVTKEEYEIYNKVAGGTFFTNVESVLFDWTVRKAFALSRLPNVDTVSNDFMTQILNICRVLLGSNEYKDKLNSFSKILTAKKIQEEKLLLEEKMKDLLDFKKKQKSKMLTLFVSAYTIVAFFVIFIFVLKDRSLYIFGDLFGAPFLSLVVVVLSMLAALGSAFLMKSRTKKIDEIALLQKRLSALEKLDAEVKKI